jgi:hypothetical protein
MIRVTTKAPRARKHHTPPGDPMLDYLPFLISANSFGVIGLIVFMGTSVIFGIPVFATRGGAQVAWAGVVGFVLTVELAVLVTLVVLISRGSIWQ